MGVDAEWLELSWNNSKPTPCLLVRPTYLKPHPTTPLRRPVFYFNARAPLGVTHNTNERAREMSTTALPCPLPTHSTRGTGRAIANEPGFVSRVVVVVVSSVVCLGLLSTEEPNGGTVAGNKHTWYSGCVSICSVRDLPWTDPPLPGTKRPKGRAGDHRQVEQFGGLGRPRACGAEQWPWTDRSISNR